MRWKKERTKRTAWLLAAPGGSKDTEERNEESDERNPALLGAVASLVGCFSGTSGLSNIG